MPNTVLVTGGTGYVASWCLAQLLQRGDTARATIRSAPKEANVRKMMANAGADTTNLQFAIADLTADDGWDTAMQGVDYVLHVASPLGNGDSSNPDDLIIPAREGALRVLRAAVKANVKRVVLTSSAAACNPGGKTDSFTDETVWTDPKLWKTNAYRLSKLLSERAAWEFMEGKTTELVTILPTASSALSSPRTISVPSR